MMKDRPAFEDYFARVTDTGLKCPDCQTTIYHGRGKANKEDPYTLRNVYACQCAGHEAKVIEGHEYDAKTRSFGKKKVFLMDRWERQNKHGFKDLYACMLPKAGLEPSDRAKMQRTGTYDASIGEAKGRSAQWHEACRIAKEAIEELITIQEGYADWKDNLPEALQESSTAALLDGVADLSLEDALDVLEEADGIDLPRGYGKD